MHIFLALNPSSAFDSKDFLDRCLSKKVVGWAEVVAKRWIAAWFSDVVNVELWLNWVSKDNLSCKLTFFQGDEPAASGDESLANLESSSEDVVLSLSNEIVLEREDIVLWILPVWVNETVSDCHSFKVDLEIIFMLEHEVVGDCWDVMSSI